MWGDGYPYYYQHNYGNCGEDAHIRTISPTTPRLCSVHCAHCSESSIRMQRYLHYNDKISIMVAHKSIQKYLQFYYPIVWPSFFHHETLSTPARCTVACYRRQPTKKWFYLAAMPYLTLVMLKLCNCIQKGGTLFHLLSAYFASKSLECTRRLMWMNRSQLFRNLLMIISYSAITNDVQ